MDPQQPAYEPPTGRSPLTAHPTFYKAIADTAGDRLSRSLIDDFVIPPRSGKAWEVPKGCIFRISTPEGPQVGDLNVWNRHNPRERFWASRTRQVEGSHLGGREFPRLWSCLPYLRPLCTMIADTLSSYGVDKHGGRVHDLLGTRCDPYVDYILTGADYNYHCHSNLTRAVLPYSLTEYDVHDVLNIFQVTGLHRESGKYFMRPSPAVKGSYVEFFAEQDLLCALSACPGGDLSEWSWEEGADERMKGTCRPLRVQVIKLEGEGRKVLSGWKEWKSAGGGYNGRHGMGVPLGESA